MKVYNCKELKSKDTNELLDLLSDYCSLKQELNKIILIDSVNEEFYVDNLLYYYELNIRKIKNELTNKINNQS